MAGNGNRMIPLLLVILFSVSSLSPLFQQNPDLKQLDEDIRQIYDTQLNSPQTVNIASWPDGSSEVIKVEIPSGESLTALSLDLEPNILPRTEEITWKTQSDWNNAETISDAVDYNLTGLSILPQGQEWDFESSNHGWTLQTGGGWMWGYDTTLGSNNGVHGGTKAIYNYNGNYPNYMSSTYWATSPSVNCQGCSGNWDLQYWKRLGVESSTWDHAYVQVKNSQGNWVQVYANSGTVNDGSYSLQTHSIGSYATNNPDLRVRFGLGTTDGSVTYTGWNVDDVSIVPAGGISGGYANWTSPTFGTAAQGAHTSVPGPYGMLSIDAEIPTGSLVSWSLLDGLTGAPISGFIDRSELVYDLGTVDWETHKSLRLKVHLASGISETPIIHGIHLQGRVHHSFNSNPLNEGWTTTGSSWSSGQMSGSGILESPEWDVRRPISRIKSAMQYSGSGHLEASIDGGAWQTIVSNGITTLDKHAHSAKFRWVSDGGSWTLTDFEIDLTGGGLPDGLRFDLSRDQNPQWSLDDSTIGPWGWQNRFSNGIPSADLTYSTASTYSVGVLLPKDVISSLMFDITPTSGTVSGVEVEVLSGASTIYTSNINNLDDSHTVKLGDLELISLTENLSLANAVWNERGLSFGSIDIKVSATSGSLQLRGLVATYNPSISMTFGAWDDMVQGINDLVPSYPATNGVHKVPLTIFTDLPGSVVVELTDLQSTSEISTFYQQINNETATLVSSWQWLEVESHHQATSGVIDKIQLDLSGREHVATFEFPVAGGPVISIGDSSYVEFHPDSPHDVSNNGTTVESIIRFRFLPEWDDEVDFFIKSRLVLADGRRSVPMISSYGIGQANGLENDIQIRHWDIVNDIGQIVPEGSEYLKAGSAISINVQLAFEGASLGVGPQSGHVDIYLKENGVEVDRTSQLTEGLGEFTRVVPFDSSGVTYEVGIDTLRGQGDATTIPVNRSFLPDSLSPIMVGSNIEKYDHFAPSQYQKLEFEIYDRPVLPSSMTLMIWRSWMDDIEHDGSIDMDEYNSVQLLIPDNLSMPQGIYHYTFDDSNAPLGSIVSGYLVGSDTAGNVLIGGGSHLVDEQLFTYQIAYDGPPVINPQGSSWAGETDYNWLHPDKIYEAEFEFTEQNGLSDVAEINLQLSSNNPSEPLLVTWTPGSSQCDIQSIHITVYSCDLFSRSGYPSPFETDLVFKIEFQLEWTFVSDEQFSHEPSIEILDRQGQGSYLNIADMRWRYSPDLLIDLSQIELEVSSGAISDNGAWVKPGSTVTVTSSIYFAKSGDTPDGLFDVSIYTSGSSKIVQVEDGEFSATIAMPLNSGNYPLSISFINLPSQARDVTSTQGLESPLIIVDGNGPEPQGFMSPREGVELSISEISDIGFDVSIKESVMLDADSLTLEWMVLPADSAMLSDTPIAEGTLPLSSTQGSLSGIIQMGAQLDLLSHFEEADLLNSMELHVWITGSDMAGNPMTTQDNSQSSPLSTWSIETNKATFRVVDVSYSKTGTISIGASVTVSVEVTNSGMVGGILNLTSKEFYLDDEERIRLSFSEVEIQAGQTEIVHIDWEITKVGPQRIEISWDGEIQAQGPIVQGKEESSGILSGSLTNVDPLYVILFTVLVLALFIVLFVAMRGGRSNDSIWDDDEDWEEEDVPAKAVPPPLSPGPNYQGSGYEHQPQYQQQQGYYGEN